MRRQIDVPTSLAILRDGEERTLTLRPGPFPLEFPKLPGPPKVGSAAPPLELDLFRGETDLAARHSRLLFFWATWCEICKQSVPEVLAFGQSRDVDVVAITDEAPETLQEFFRTGHAEFPAIVARDPRRRVFRSYGVSGTPTFVLVDRDGVIRHYQTGYPAEGLRVEGWHWRDEARILSAH
jgi:peroxiredoxin